MLLTVKQAAEHWCPEQARAGQSARCVGCRCMAWRWADPLRPRVVVPGLAEDGYREEEPKRPYGLPESYQWSPPDGDPGSWVEPDEEANQRRNGYCGLAGRPDL